MRLEIGQHLSVILLEPIKHAVRGPFPFVHDDGDDVMTAVSG